MNKRNWTRREALTQTGLLGGVALALGQLGTSNAAGQVESSPKEPAFRFCLNTATLRGHKLGIVKEIEIASQAGYSGIEPWVDSIQDYVKGGGNLKDLRQRIADGGLTVESAIGFPEWIVNDDARRTQGLERAKREMDLIAQIGGRRFAAPPAGATDLPKLDLLQAAERYRALLLAGDGIGIVPQLELWGFSKNLNRLGECVCVAMEAAHPKACVLADVFHLYKGGSDFRGMRLLGRDVIQVLHMNDYPSDPPPDKIDDSYRVYPGDATAPLPELLRTLRQTGGQKVLSLEVFNRDYWKQEPLAVAKTGIAKMKAVAELAVAG
ncbi:MAG: sugar phosphate isomerase/epimerase family protein [Verrucomicrobiota bacterium]